MTSLPTTLPPRPESPVGMRQHVGAPRDEEELVRTHLPVVGYLVSETLTRVPPHVRRDDLAAAGLVALGAAARSWDPSRGVPFSRYAGTRVRGALLDELRGMDWASRSVRRTARARDRAEEQLAAALGRRPERAEVAAHLGIGVDALDGDQQDLHRATVLSVEALGGPSDVGDLVADRAPSPEEELLHREKLGYLVDAVAALPERLRTVVEGYFLQERPMTEIAQELGVSESRVSQLRSEALLLLRDALNGQLAPELVPSPRRPGGSVDRRRDAYFSAVASRSDYRTRLDRGTAASPPSLDGVA